MIVADVFSLKIGASCPDTVFTSLEISCVSAANLVESLSGTIVTTSSA